MVTQPISKSCSSPQRQLSMLEHLRPAGTQSHKRLPPWLEQHMLAGLNHCAAWASHHSTAWVLVCQASNLLQGKRLGCMCILIGHWPLQRQVIPVQKLAYQSQLTLTLCSKSDMGVTLPAVGSSPHKRKHEPDGKNDHMHVHAQA